MFFRQKKVTVAATRSEMHAIINVWVFNLRAKPAIIICAQTFADLWYTRQWLFDHLVHFFAESRPIRPDSCYNKI